MPYEFGWTVALDGEVERVAPAVPVVAVVKVGGEYVPAVCPLFVTLSETVIVCPLVSWVGVAVIVFSVNVAWVSILTGLELTELFVKVTFPPLVPLSAV